jgi:hypothetical protein
MSHYIALDATRWVIYMKTLFFPLGDQHKQVIEKGLMTSNAILPRERKRGLLLKSRLFMEKISWNESSRMGR